MEELFSFIDSIKGWMPTIITGLILFYWERMQAKRDKEKEAKESLRDEAEDVNREVNSATMELSYATAVALKRGKTNGEVENGIKAYEEAKKRQEIFNQKLQEKVIK